MVVRCEPTNGYLSDQSLLPLSFLLGQRLERDVPDVFPGLGLPAVGEVHGLRVIQMRHDRVWKRNRCSEKQVDDAIRRAMAFPLKICYQCYKHFTGLHLQVCKIKSVFKINKNLMCCQIQYADACFHF